MTHETPEPNVLDLLQSPSAKAGADSKDGTPGPSTNEEGSEDLNSLPGSRLRVEEISTEFEFAVSESWDLAIDDLRDRAEQLQKDRILVISCFRQELRAFALKRVLDFVPALDGAARQVRLTSDSGHGSRPDAEPSDSAEESRSLSGDDGEGGPGSGADSGSGSGEDRTGTRHGSESDPRDLNLESLARARSRAKPTLLIVDIDPRRERPEALLHSVRQTLASESRSIGINQELEATERYIVCLASPADVRGTRAPETNARLCWEVPFVPSYFEGFEVADKDSLSERVYQFLDYAERDVYEYVDWLSKQGRDHLLGFLRQLDGESGESDGERSHTAKVGIALPGAEGASTGDVLENGKVSVEAIAYILATYFPDLSPYEFNLLLSTLIQESAVPDVVTGEEYVEESARPSKTSDSGGPGAEASSPETESGVDPSSDVSIARRVMQKTEPALQYYLGAPNAILRKAGLVTLQAKSGGEYVGFVSFLPRAQRRERIRFLSSHLRDRIYGILQTNGLVFDSSAAISSAMIDMTVEMSEADPKHHGLDWLLRIMSAASEIGPQRSTHSEPGSLGDFLERLERAKAEGWLLHRLARLLRAMHAREPLVEQCVQPALREFIRKGMGRQLVTVLLELDALAEFDMFGWLRRLVDGGTSHDREVAVHAIQRRADVRKSELLRLLGALAGWLPDEDRDFEHYSPSARLAASHLPVLLLLSTRDDLPEPHHGEWPSQHPLFRGDTEVTDGDRVLEVMLTMTHKGVRAALGRRWAPYLAGVLANTYSALLGREPAHEVPERFVERMLKRVADRLDRDERRLLIEQWRRFSDGIREASEGRAHAEGRPLALRRKAMRRLIRSFKSVIKS